MATLTETLSTWLKNIDDNVLPRDQEMVKNIRIELDKGKRVIVFAGAHHVISRENSPSTMLSLANIQFVSLTPQEEETMQAKEGELIIAKKEPKKHPKSRFKR